MQQTTDMKTTDKQEIVGTAEQMRSGPVFAPAIDFFESDQAIILLADLPGVRSDDLQIDLREGVLKLRGDVRTPENENEQDVIREYRTGTFIRQFSLSEKIDQAAIEATLANGVLRLELPKVKAAMPRQIKVKTR